MRISDRYSNGLTPNEQQTPGKRRKIVKLLVLGLFLLSLLTWFAYPVIAKSLASPLSASIGPSRSSTTALGNILQNMTDPTPMLGADGKMYEKVGEYLVRYTLDPELQSCAEELFKSHKVPYGALIAIEPKTGRVLAMAEFSNSDRQMKGFVRRATYPAASLIKVITSSAAVKTGKVGPDTKFRYEGSPYVLSKRKISPKNYKRDRFETTLGEALGKSNNVVFAKVGINYVGPQKLLEELNGFGFNTQIPFDFPLQMSTAVVPLEEYPFARTSAGFGDVYLSPIHAALIGAAVANNGVMMKPYVIDQIVNAKGEVVYKSEPMELMRPVSEEVSKTLTTMMVNTVSHGTATKVFARHGKKLADEVGVAGKTGSLSGDDPPGLYEWFVGFAPLNNPDIAVAGLVVNRGDAWRLKGNSTAATVLVKHFGL